MEKSTKRKVTLFLDTETLERLDAIANQILAGSSKSNAVRFLAKEYEEKSKQNK